MCFSQMSKGTFAYVLEMIRPDITKVNLVGDIIDPEIRLAFTLTFKYPLGYTCVFPCNCQLC